jgi:hypothetical protein
MTAKHYIYLANSTTVKLEGLESSVDASYVNDATVEMTIKDAQGNNVAGETWPLSMVYVTASNGNYLGEVSHALALVDGAEYSASITATVPGGSRAEWVEPLAALIRTRETQALKWWPK